MIERERKEVLECEWTSVRVRECKTERENERESVRVLK